MPNQTTNEVLCPKCSEPMKEIRYDVAYDWDGKPIQLDYVAYHCENRCFNHRIDRFGNKVPFPPLRQGYLTYGKRIKCSYCGMLLKSHPGICYYNKESGYAIHVPYFGRVQCFFCNSEKRIKRKGNRNQLFKRYINIPKKVSDKWYVDVLDLLESYRKGTGYYSGETFRFAYSPVKREFLVFEDKVPSQEDNKTPEKGATATSETYMYYVESIKQYGTDKFEHYICGRYLIIDRERKKIIVQEHENEEWMMETHMVLRRMGVPEEVEIVWTRNLLD